MEPNMSACPNPGRDFRANKSCSECGAFAMLLEKCQVINCISYLHRNCGNACDNCHGLYCKECIDYHDDLKLCPKCRPLFASIDDMPREEATLA